MQYLCNPHYNITNVPAFLTGKLERIFNSIGESNIKSFNVCKDKRIQILVRREGGENGLYLSHNLLWNVKIERYTSKEVSVMAMMGGCNRMSLDLKNSFRLIWAIRSS